MFLTASNLAHYLMAHGFVPASAIVNGDFGVMETGRRNRNFKVLREKGEGLFVKQVKSLESQAVGTIWREAAIAARLQSEPAYEDIARMMPRLVSYDGARHALITKLVEGSETAGEYQSRSEGFPLTVARGLGELLARVHSYGPVIAGDSYLQPALPRQIPWVMTLDRSGAAFLGGLGPAGVRLASDLHSAPHLLAMLAGLRSEWTFTALIHGDIKWDNCLLTPVSGGAVEFRLADWELADLGDPAWDLAGIFKEYISAALFRTLGGAAASPESDWLAEVRPAAREFWKAYAAEAALGPEVATAFRDRAVRFTAARMIIAVLEFLSASSDDGRASGAMLGVARALLESQLAMTASLLGYPS